MPGPSDFRAYVHCAYDSDTGDYVGVAASDLIAASYDAGAEGHVLAVCRNGVWCYVPEQEATGEDRRVFVG